MKSVKITLLEHEPGQRILEKVGCPADKKYCSMNAQFNKDFVRNVRFLPRVVSNLVKVEVITSSYDRMYLPMVDDKDDRSTDSGSDQSSGGDGDLNQSRSRNV